MGPVLWLFNKIILDSVGFCLFVCFFMNHSIVEQGVGPHELSCLLPAALGDSRHQMGRCQTPAFGTQHPGPLGAVFVILVCFKRLHN